MVEECAKDIESLKEDEEGKNVTAALMDYAADSEYVISSNQGVTMSDGSTLTAAETVAWVGGVTAGAKITESNTAKKFPDRQEFLSAGDFLWHKFI